jgi:hypothetical protein
MSFSEFKLYMTSLFAFSVTYSTLDKTLKIVLLIITIGYAIDKWINHRRNNFKD